MNKDSPTTTDAWQRLRLATAARIALGRAGGSLPTGAWLEFKAAHAAARDAVHNEFDAEQLALEIRALGVETIVVDSAAGDRATYLQRPDLGRRLSDESRAALDQVLRTNRAQNVVSPDLAIIASDGLSAWAAERHVGPLLGELVPKLTGQGWSLAPIVVARFGRVALEDEVGDRLGVRIALMLIGERPGLGSPDSLGAYLVYGPKLNNTDANRNCISNIRPDGLAIGAAAETIFYLLSESRRRKISGVNLKDQRELPSPSSPALPAQ